MIIDESLSPVYTSVLLIALNVLLLALFTGLARALMGPTLEDRFSALLLLGSSGIGILFILALLFQLPALYDVALIVALLAVVMTVALTRRHKTND